MKLNKSVIVFVIIFCAFIGNFIRYSQRAPKRHYCDFRVYYATGERFINREDIYSRPDEAITPYKYSPMFAFLFAPLSLFSKNTASLIFFTLNFISVILICFLSKKIISSKLLSFRKNFLLFFFPILFTFRFILQVWDSGQVNLIMLLLVAAGLYFLKRKWTVAGAASLGLSIMFKYMPAVFIPYFLVKKKFKLVALILAFVLLFCCIPALYVGVDQQIGYLKSWLPFITQTSLDTHSWTDFKNQSIYSMFLRFLTKIHDHRVSFFNLDFRKALIISMMFAAGLYSLVLIPKDDTHESINYALLFLCMAILNPNAWMLNFVVFLFVYIFLIYYLITTGFKDKVTLALMVLGFALSSWASESVVGNNIENFFEELSSVTLGALVLFYALVRMKFKGLGEKINGG